MADPIKILKGRLIVFAGFVVYSIVTRIYPPTTFVLGIGFLFLLPWFVVRSLCFNARNSSWRNIRFNFFSTYGEAAKVFVLFPFLSVFTVGILGPYAYYRQKKFIVENSSYGTTAFSFHASAMNYYRLILTFLPPLAIAGGVMVTTAVLLPSSWPPR